MSDINVDSLNKKQRLGRGLGSLLGGQQQQAASDQPLVTPKSQSQSVVQPVNSMPSSGLVSAGAAVPLVTQQVPPESRIWNVAIDKLQASQFQPRTYFEKESLVELANSIRENGILQPIVARRLDQNRIEIIAGERRWRAAQIAGLHEVPVILKTLKNKEALELAIIENVQREDLNPIEEAEAYQRLVDEFSLTQQQVADKVGKERATVANSLRLLQLVPKVREMLVGKQISAGHAKILLSVQDPKHQIKLAERVHKETLSVRQLEKLSKIAAADDLEKIETKEQDKISSRLIQSLSDDLQKALGTKVHIEYQNSKGKISIHFYSDEELNQLTERLKDGCQN